MSETDYIAGTLHSPASRDTGSGTGVLFRRRSCRSTRGLKHYRRRTSQRSFGVRTANTGFPDISQIRMTLSRRNAASISKWLDTAQMTFAVWQRGNRVAEYVDLSERITATFYDDEHEEGSEQNTTVKDVLDSVCDDYTVLPSAQPGWIPCSERLPADDGGYLITAIKEDKLITHVGIWYKGDHWVLMPREYVLAWMPLPEPYKEEQDG